LAKDEEVTIERQIELAMAQLEKDFGKNAVMRLNNEPLAWPAISTRSLTLDMALGIGGLPKGRIVEIFGPESSGKSTMCLQVVAEAQSVGGTCLFVDAEHAVDPQYAKALGVNLENLLFAQPSYGEEAIDILEKMVKTGGIDVAVIDSVAALVPKAELDGDMSTEHMGRQPRLMAKAMRKMVALSAETETLIIFTNQIREKIGVMFGNPETQPGGRSLKFAASVRVDLRKIKDLKDSDGNIVGSRIKAKVIKNKMAPPLRLCEFDVLYGKGVDYFKSVLEMGVEVGVIDQTPNGWLSYGEEKLGHGFDKAIEHLASDKEFSNKLKEEIIERVRT